MSVPWWKSGAVRWFAGLALVVAVGGIAYAALSPGGASRCASLYAETGDEQFRNASAWNCFWEEQRRAYRLEIQDAEMAGRRQALAVVRKKEPDPVAEHAHAAEVLLVNELREPICVELLKYRLSADKRPGKTLAVDLMALSGHSSVFSFDEVCRDCADMMSSYSDAAGKRFCTVGGKGGRPCLELKQFPETASASREGTAEDLWRTFDCQ